MKLDALKSQITGGFLRLTAEELGISEEIFKEIFGTHTLEFQAITIVVDKPSRLRVEAKGQLFGNSHLQFECTWEEKAGRIDYQDLAVYFNKRMPGQFGIPPLLLKCIRITLDGIHSQPELHTSIVGESYPLIYQGIESQTKLETEVLPDAWQIHLSGVDDNAILQLATMQEVFHLFGDQQETTLELPLLSEGWQDLSLAQATLTFDTSERKVVAMGLSLEMGIWQPFPNVSLLFQNNQVDLHYKQHTKEWSAQVKSRLPLSTSSLDLEGYLQLKDQTWEFQLKGQLDEEVSFLGCLRQILPEIPNQVQELVDLRLEGLEFCLLGDGTINLLPKASLSFFELAKRLGIKDIPQGISEYNLPFQAIPIRIDPLTWTISLFVEPHLSFPAGGGSQHLELVRSEVKVKYEDGNTITTCSMILAGAASLAPGFEMQTKEVRLSWDQEEGWAASGTVEAIIFGSTGHKLLVGFDQSRQVIFFSYEKTGAAIPVIDSANVQLDLRELSLELLALEQEEGYQYTGLGKGHLQLGPQDKRFLEEDLVIELRSSPREKYFILLLEGKISSQIILSELPKGDLAVDLALEDIRLQAGTGEAYHWGLEASLASIQLRVPPYLEPFFPVQGMDCGFTANQDGITIRSLSTPWALPALPELRFKLSEDQSYELGRLEFAIEEFAIRLGEDRGLQQEISVRLPDRLKQFVQPILDLQNFNFQLEVGKGVKLKPLSSPILTAAGPKPIEGKEPDTLWFVWDLKGFGELKLQLPEFSRETGGWKAAGGWEQSNLGLPLRAMGQGLMNIIAPANEELRRIVEFFPEQLPLSGINFGSVEEMEELLGASLPDPLKKVISFISEQMEKLPAAIKPYLEFQLPEAFDFAVQVKDGGHVQLDLSTHDSQHPLRLLLPIIQPMPGLVGLSLFRLSIAPMFGGQLIMIEVDGQLDWFSAVDLIANIAGDQREFKHSLIARETLAVLPTAFPIPIPIFYSNLGLDNRGVLGIEAATFWRFPKPQFDSVFDLIAIIEGLYRFFTDRSYLLHEHLDEFLPKENQFIFSAGDNYLALPNYLGGGRLDVFGPYLSAMDTEPVTGRKWLELLNFSKLLAHFFDFLKTGRFPYLISTIPLYQPLGGEEKLWLRMRTEDLQLKFGPVQLGLNAGIKTAWCICTEQEFLEDILPSPEGQEMLQAANPNGEIPDGQEILRSLPNQSESTHGEAGFIVLIMGGWHIADLATFTTRFGIAFTNTGGFETGITIFGQLGAVALNLHGYLQATKDEENRAQNEGEIVGECSLQIDEQETLQLTGAIRWDAQQITMGVSFSLPNTAFNIAGVLSFRKEEISLVGKLSWPYRTNSQMEGAAEVKFLSEGLVVQTQGQLYDTHCNLQVLVTNGLLHTPYQMELAVELDDQYEKIAQEEIKTAVAEVQAEQDKLLKELEEVKALLAANGEHTVSNEKAILTVLDYVYNRIEKLIRDGINNYFDGVKWPKTKYRNEALEKGEKEAGEVKAKILSWKNAVKERNISKWKKSIRDFKQHRVKVIVAERTFYNKTIETYLSNGHKETLNKADKHAKLILGHLDQRVKIQELMEEFPATSKLKAAIGRAIDEGTKDTLQMVPKLHRVTAAGPLTLTEQSELECQVDVRRVEDGQEIKIQIPPVLFDLSEPSKSIRQIMQLVVNAL